MNPTAGLADLDALPLHPCPVCLRKRVTVTGAPLPERFAALAEFAGEQGLADSTFAPVRGR
jgi:hypothetical protein